MLYKELDPKSLEINHRELSCRLSSPEAFLSDGDVRFEKLLKVLKPAYMAERVSIVNADGGVYVGGAFTSSRALAKVAAECDECFVLICTLGIGPDKLIAKEQIFSVYDAFVIDAIADALIESVCDAAEKELSRGERTVPRFSPGYSDLPLEFGGTIISLLRADRVLGIRITESGMMVPRKSVSAIICIKRDKKEKDQ